ATGEWVLMADGDDLLINPHYIARAVELAESQPDIVLLFGKHLIGADVASASVSNEAPGLPAVMDGSAFFLEHPPFLGIEPKALTALVRRTAAVAIDFYRCNILSSDFESYYRLMVGHRVAFLDEIAGLWRQHKGNLSKSRSFEIYRDNFRAITGPYEHARALGVFSPAELQSWLRRSAGRYTLFCLRRLLTVGRVWDAAKLIAFMSRVDAGIIGHALARAARRTQRGLNDRLGISGEGGGNGPPRRGQGSGARSEPWPAALPVERQRKDVGRAGEVRVVVGIVPQHLRPPPGQMALLVAQPRRLFAALVATARCRLVMDKRGMGRPRDEVAALPQLE